MFRFFGSLIVAILLIAIIATSILWWKQTGITGHFLAKSLKTTVCLDKANFGFSGVEVENLTVENPNQEEAAVPNLFATNEIEVHVSPFALFGDEIIIPEIEIETCILGVVLYNRVGSDNSWSRMLKSEPKGGKPSGDKKKRQVVIQKLIVNNLYLNVYSVVDGRRLAIPAFDRIEIDNIGAGASIPADLIANIVFEQVIEYVLNNLDVGDLLIKAVGGTGDPKVEIPALLIDQAIKKVLKRPEPGELPSIPRGKHCYTP